MAEKAFDLFLDESGSFTKKGEHTLVGGVLIPHEMNPSSEMFRKWEADIRSGISSSGVYDPRDLAAGDEWHDLFVKSRRKNGLSGAESLRFSELEQSKRYVFAHCSENPAAADRWKAQGWVLDEFLKRLSGVQGIPVLFDNPNGVYHIDSNTTFMSVFASGVVRLYDHLMETYPNDGIVLYIHAASRANITRKLETDQYDVSPLAGKEANLERSLYLNQIRNFVFLNGGFELLDLDAFGKSLDSFEIIEDLVIGGKPVPNPSTVICDYICNCALTHTAARKYLQSMKACGLLHIQAFGRAPDLSEGRIARMVQDHDWLSFLKTLISREFPDRETEEFFAGMNRDRYDQRNCVDGLVPYLRPFVENRETMPLWLRLLDLILSRCSGFAPAARLSLQANLLIYKHSLLTHLGRDVTETQQAFADCVQQIRSVEQRDLLLLLFCNRQIVTETDCFNYSKGREWFEAVRQYSEKQLKNSDELMTWFALLCDRKEARGCSEQYGKALGSYIQLLTKEYRPAAPERKAEIKKEAEACIALVSDQLPENDSRASQNACDFHAETGDYDLSMDCLARSVGEDRGEAGESFASQARAVISRCGRFGEYNRFAYLHYVSLMHRCFIHHDPRGEILLGIIADKPFAMDQVNHLVGDPYPDAAILRHLAASLAYSQGMRALAQKLFECSAAALVNRGDLFHTLSVSVRAEMIALGLEEKLPGDRKDWQKKAEAFLTKSFPNYLRSVKYHPFPAVPENLPQADYAKVLYQLADSVVY